MGPYFPEAGPNRERILTITPELRQFRCAKLNIPDTSPGLANVTLNSAHASQEQRDQMARRLRGIEKDAWRTNAAGENEALVPIEVAMQRFTKKESIEEYHHDVNQQFRLYGKMFSQARGETAMVGMFLTLYAVAIPLGSMILPFIAPHVAPILMSAVVLSMFPPRNLYRICVPNRSQAATHHSLLDDFASSRLDWHFAGINYFYPAGMKRLIGRQVSSVMKPIDVFGISVMDSCGYILRKGFGDMVGWMGIDRLLTRDPESGEPTLTVVVRTGAQLPDYPTPPTRSFWLNRFDLASGQQGAR